MLKEDLEQLALKKFIATDIYGNTIASLFIQGFCEGYHSASAEVEQLKKIIKGKDLRINNMKRYKYII